MKLGQDIVKYRYIIMGVFVGLVVLACCLFPSMMEKVNYDFTSYLPKGYMTSDGYDFLSQNFNIHGDVDHLCSKSFTQYGSTSKVEGSSRWKLW